MAPKWQWWMVRRAKSAGKIAGLKLVHGIALAPEFNHGFISDGAANQVVVFDLTTLAKVGEVAAGMNPDGIIYDPATKRVFAFNGRGASATVVDAEKGHAGRNRDAGREAGVLSAGWQRPRLRQYRR